MYICWMEYNHTTPTRKMLTIGALVLLSIALQSCGATRGMEHRRAKKIKSMLLKPSVYEDGFIGFYLYDPKRNKVLVDHHGHRHFTPASNTKVMTYYVTTEVLGDSFPVVRYLDRDSTRYIRGMGYPLLPDSTFTAFLLQADRVVDCTKRIPRFGSGWAWDDYPYSYQKERDLLPLYENALHFSKGNYGYKWYPAWPGIVVAADTMNGHPLQRMESANHFIYDPHRWEQNDTVEIPLYGVAELRNGYFSSEGRRGVKECPSDWSSAKVLRYEMVDTVFQRLLHASDNYIAEQLLLMAAEERDSFTRIAQFIQWAKDSILAGMPDKTRWVDGSGLSRYNLQTPANLVWLLNKILYREGKYKVIRRFPAAGKSGTLATAYPTLVTPKKGVPFVYAKSGSLSNNYCLSGYIFTSKGRVLIFSFMANHFMHPTSEVKKALEPILYRIYEKF